MAAVFATNGEKSTHKKQQQQNCWENKHLFDYFQLLSYLSNGKRSRTKKNAICLLFGLVKFNSTEFVQMMKKYLIPVALCSVSDEHRNKIALYSLVAQALRQKTLNNHVVLIEKKGEFLNAFKHRITCDEAGKCMNVWTCTGIVAAMNANRLYSCYSIKQKYGQLMRLKRMWKITEMNDFDSHSNPLQ